MAKVISIAEAVDMVQEGMTIMVSGFWGIGAPEKVIDALVEKGTGNLTGISISTSLVDRGIGKLVANRQFKKVIVSYIGRNPATMEQYEAGQLEVEFVPQGTLAERIRAGGFGLGGILTPTGVGTELEKGKQRMTIDGKDYLLELPLKADIALIKAHKADKSGNLIYRKAARNTNPLMAAAADITIVQADEIVETGMIDPDEVMTPGIFVDYLVQG
ncbi:MAG: acetate CoA/acetoacetate CoA-transferase alpha subunit [Clostridia bacterium]|nr:acetate CoA/acetoacetate CoA-transferase alpha subunit [Clostridia bacterium]MDN5323364.1 acetate CoA/acetoacetate CoA-transferase alpha subunit [Clostridia bacterium]